MRNITSWAWVAVFTLLLSFNVGMVMAGTGDVWNFIAIPGMSLIILSEIVAIDKRHKVQPPTAKHPMGFRMKRPEDDPVVLFMATAMDRHWLSKPGESEVACSCGKWKMTYEQINRDPLGKQGHLMPFSLHVAQATVEYLKHGK